MHEPRPRAYPSDLTDAQWRRIADLVPKPKPGGRPATVERRAIVDAILYFVREGCQWRGLPKDFPAYTTVYHSFRAWTRDGTWERLHDAIRAEVRTAADRDPDPSAAVLDAQSVKTGGKGGARGPRGYDAGKRVRGRKRPLAVDTLGLVLAVVVTAANVQDKVGARLLADRLAGRVPRLRVLWADGGYRSRALAAGLAALGWLLVIVGRSSGQRGFQALPKRWVVERTFAWLGNYRRLSKDYEVLPETSEAVVRVAMLHLMLRRLEP